ncbi:hypothetical protein HYS90_01120 [Candidatus Curtissbacteria bacterium]|nr:hypothetical protein [Candidatus Curtissbacteria bacterium]
MLNPNALANGFAATTALVYFGLYLLKLVAPPFFKLLLNSQFLGADIASQVPRLGLGGFLGILIAISVFAWIWGYLVAVFYNRFASKN